MKRNNNLWKNDWRELIITESFFLNYCMDSNQSELLMKNGEFWYPIKLLNLPYSKV